MMQVGHKPPKIGMHLVHSDAAFADIVHLQQSAHLYPNAADGSAGAAPDVRKKDAPMTYRTDTRTAETGLAGTIAGLRTAFADARARRAAYRQTVYELGSLSNRELADLGIYRSMIRQIATDVAKGVRA